MAAVRPTRSTVSVDVTDTPYPGTKTFGALVTVKSGNRKHQYRMSIPAESAEEAGRGALEKLRELDFGAYKSVVRV